MDTILQTAAGVRVLLRRPSEQALPSDDIKLVLKNLLRGYAQDLKLNHRDRTTEVMEVDIDEDDVDFILTGPNVDYEAERLEYEVCDGQFSARREVRLVDYAAWPRQYDGPNNVASLYGQDKVAINMPSASVCGYRWFLVYRPSLLSLIQNEAPVPLPDDFIPMLQNEAAILSMPLVKDDSAEWVAWMARTLPTYNMQRTQWNNPDDPSRPGRWQYYLSSSVEPQIQPIQRSDRHRGRTRRVSPSIPFQ
jgi:hypothetical protein